MTNAVLNTKEESDVRTIGNPDLFQLLSSVSSEKEEWSESVMAMEVHGGCVVKTTVQRGLNIVQSLVYVPGVRIVGDVKAGRKLSHF